MKQKIYLHIPEPCHEKWNEMTPSAKGRYCKSCAKTVIDFTTMTDAEVLRYVSVPDSRLCGRFMQDQLKRPLAEIKKEKKKNWWLAICMAILLFLNKAGAQKKQPDVFERIIAWDANSKRPLNENRLSNHNKEITIHGKVADENSQPVTGAAVIIKGSRIGMVTDTAGAFSLKLDTDSDSATIIISYVGYESIELSYSLQNSSDINAGVQYFDIRKTSVMGFVGEVVVTNPIKKVDTIRTNIQKFFTAKLFTVYPNPVLRGHDVNIRFNKAGDYTIHLLDANSTLINHSVFNPENKNAITTLHIPQVISSGVYLIAVLDNKTKKKYTDKLLIQ